MSKRSKEWRSVVANVLGESGKALHLRCVYRGEPITGWFPRSQIECSENYETGYYGVLVLSEWICEAKRRETRSAPSALSASAMLFRSGPSKPTPEEDDEPQTPIMLTCRSCGIERSPGILFCEVCLEPWVKLKSTGVDS